ncbi:MAG: aconitate hydratase AcnA [Anaerolineae bacterium]
MSLNSFGARSTLSFGGRDYEIYRLDALEKAGLDITRLPYSLKILLENLLRNEDGKNVTHDDIRTLAQWDPKSAPTADISFMPGRVLMQDFTGVPLVVDLATMRDAVVELGGDPDKVNPLSPAEMVIDHSVQVDVFGTSTAVQMNTDLEYRRNQERYAFLRWAQTAFENFKVVPPRTGIVHQVNLEYLARVVFAVEKGGKWHAYPDTLVGTDSHTTMVNGLGVLGWGVGGIEAEAALLGQPMSMLIPQVVGFRLTGQLPSGATATDLVLTVTEMLRKKGVVGMFVEFFGPGLHTLTLADRATIGNMSPEFGSTVAIFPVDEQTLRYLRFSGRAGEHVDFVERYMTEQGLFHTATSPDAEYSSTLELDLGAVVPSIAGPRRPQDRVKLAEAREVFLSVLPTLVPPAPAGQVAVASTSDEEGIPVIMGREEFELDHGSVVIAAITSCTNTSNPSVMVGAGLVAKKAAERGLKARPWVKTSLAPGSRVVTDYLDAADLTRYLDEVGFYTVGYGCTTCIGNSGPLPPEISAAIEEGKLVVCSVLSGNRNFEGRIQGEVRANYLMSPPLVVAYALAGRMDIDLMNEPLAEDKDGQPVYLKDIWPMPDEIEMVIQSSLKEDMYRKSYAEVFTGDENWNALTVPEGDRYAWDAGSTYIARPPFFEHMPKDAPASMDDIQGARVLVMVGDSITTDHISPAGSIRANSPAGQYLISHGVEVKDFNTYGARRGNHEVMMRGTFANIRLRNHLVPGREGWWTRHFPDGHVVAIYDAAMRYQAEGVPLIVLAGKEYGTGSSRDWAAKGTRLLGVSAVLAESFERIHRSNLVGLGVLPLQYKAGQTAEGLGLTGEETFDILGLTEGVRTSFADGREVTVRATKPSGEATEFAVVVRLDTAQEVIYYRHGGILQFVLRQMLAGA